jgi:hypothetical protein
MKPPDRVGIARRIAWVHCLTDCRELVSCRWVVEHYFLFHPLVFTYL